MFEITAKVVGALIAFLAVLVFAPPSRAADDSIGYMYISP